MYKIDLHSHTNYSDGILSPAELVEQASQNKITTLAITDHDSVNGIKEAIIAGNDLGVRVVPGVELSTDVDDRDVHLLGLFLDIDDEELLKYLEFFREERLYRAKRIVRKLNGMGHTISIDDVLAHANNSAVGRPHIALAMIDRGIVSGFYEAFQKFIGDYGPAFERKIHVSPKSALKIIADAGGLSFIAHPGHMHEHILTTLIKSGIDGIEVIHPSHKEFQVKFYRGIVNQYCLLETGGSDFHGGGKGDVDNFGKYFISQSKFDAMQKMLHRNSA
ncbi:MAG: PHP domain-containing protein [Melioribacteraceae bacterium]|nr:PHP domain-containing protein [Melioribacteraceae bacterium]